MAHQPLGAAVSKETGQVLTLVALFMTCLLVMLGLAIDLGFLYYFRRHAQTAADAAARAAVLHLYPATRDETLARQAALDYAATNGFDNNGTENTVTVNIPPLSGPYAGNTNFAEVLVTRSFTTVFLSIVSRDWAEASARAVGGVKDVLSSIAFLSLSTSACPAVRLSSDAQLTVTNGAFVVNGTCSEALRVSSTAVLTAPSVQVVGGYRKDAGATISPTPQTGATAGVDPLASLAAPSFTGLTVRHGTAASPSTWDLSSGATTLNPGIYYGGLRIRGSATVTMQSGAYIMAGGGLTVSDTATLNGSGVFIYNTKDPSNSSGAGAYASVSLDVDAPGGVTLSPPSSGAYTGILLFQDRANTLLFQIRGSLSSLAGTLYFPTAAVEARIAGGAHTAQIIALEFQMTAGGSSLTVNLNASAAYRTSQAYLSE
ncbi:MAG: hypothetical protein HYY02_08570 [Chloroflexi bacterium]|nr:hypothetical protein [Chloroflexota bacterium]